MDNERLINSARERAADNHRNGLNCGESTFRGLLETLREAKMTKLPMDIVSLATGFGGGIGSSGNTCCAIIGGSMAISVIHGRKDPYELPTPEARIAQLGGEEGRYRLYNNMVHDFRVKNGTTCCAELTCPYDYYSDERKIFCRSIIGETAALAMKWILVGIEEGYAHPFKYNIMGAK
ncbi:MAG TPA: C-GCAxxG-C-C family protein [Syntrophales bacterium]|nr:C-GCAxxG-C-C family protein [Syntrophales bacterium]